jgi:hypothetical protein
MMSLAETAAATQGRAHGPDVRYAGVSTDSRGIGRGELFVAIRGERFDGHDFLGMAHARGAAAALIDERYDAKAPLPVVVVDDTRKALGRLGRHWRARFAPAVIGLAGANGKTTTKEMLAAILRAHAGENAVLATKGNLNTDIGVPLTVLGMRDAHRYCAVELRTFELEACQISLSLLHEAGVHDLDQWLSDFAACDFAYLKHVYETGERRPFHSFWTDGSPLLAPVHIPPFTPRKWLTRWAGVVV